MTSANSQDRTPRRRQEDRSAETRRKLIEATIDCLYRVGYSSVTIAMVAKEAGVSKGNIAHQFSTKSDLMVAVRDYVYVMERDLLEEERVKLGTKAYLEQLPKLVLAGMRKPPAIAVNEILLASRGDPELIDKLRDTERRIEKRSLEELTALYAEIGETPSHKLILDIRVSVAAFRGLAIAELVQGPDADVEASIQHVMRIMGRASSL